MRSETATFVLLPGAGGESWYWHRVVPLLRERGHEVIAPDLPCGEAGAGLAEYADATVDAIGDRRGVILVAQSMGAFTAPLVCGRADVARLVLVAPMIPAPGETPGGWWSSSGQEAAQRALDLREGRDPDAPFDIMSAFFHDVPEDVVAAAFARPAPPQEDTAFEQPWPLDAWPDVPTSVVAGRHDRLLPLEFVRELAATRIGVEAGVVDTGHLPALARPAELVAWLERDRLAAGL
jgi:pimeloyl-ACP methyl ester carboxylesterase